MAQLDRARVIDYLTGLSPPEMEDLILDLEERLGIERLFGGWFHHATMGVAPGPSDEEPTEFDVVLLSAGEARIPVIRALRSILDVGLAAARTVLDQSPVVIAEALCVEHAQAVCEQLRAAGAEVKLR